MKSKALGSLLILVGTAIGAGMLALPMTSSELHFPYAAGLLICIWAMMTFTGFLVLEVNLSIDSKFHNFSSMAKATLGRAGQTIAWLACLLLLYSLTWAYISGNASLITSLFAHHSGFTITNTWSTILFTAIFGGAVYWSTRAVDWLNRGLMSVKGILVLLTLALLLPKIQWQHLFPHQAIAHHAALIAAPIFLTSFGYHTVIPSIRTYVGPNPKLIKKIILIGTLIPLVCYLLWMASSLGILPLTGPQSFASVKQQGGSVGQFVQALNAMVHNPWVETAINGFSNIAMTTSFLGVTLGLFDFIADAFRRQNHRIGRTQTALITFLPPLLLSLLFPNGFILALGYAAIFVAVLEVLLPVAMVYSLRKKSPAATALYRVRTHSLILGFVFLLGCALIVAQLIH